MATHENSTALARANEPAALERLQGTSRDAHAITSMLAEAGKSFHLVSPSTSVGDLPDGFSVATSTVLVDVKNETYAIGGDDDGGSGKRGLAKAALDRIANAAGVSWDSRQCRRLDDRSDPYYCSFQAVGRVKQFDGSEIEITGTKDVDFRDGAPAIEAVHERYRAKKARAGNGFVKPPDAQIREMRLHILALAESKAKNRAVRSLGIRTSYTAAELAKPFVVARLFFDGRSEDPETRRMFARISAERALGATRALFGEAAAFAPAPAPMAYLPAPTPPPPIGSRDAEDDEGDRGETQPSAAPTPAPAAPPTPRDAPRSSGFTVPGGDYKGRAIEEEDVPVRTLEYWAKRIDESIGNGTSRNAQRDELLLAALNAELDRREASGTEAAR